MAENLAAALAKAQGQLLGARKDAQNPHLRNKYADLASCWDACRAALSANGLSVTQTVRHLGPHVVLVTTLHHVSGEMVADEGIPVIYNDGAKGLNPMQAMGSALTYARRYGLCAMVGICPEDDDGAGADSPRREEKPKAASPPPASKPMDEAQRATMRENLCDSLREAPDADALKVRYTNAYRAAKKASDEALCEELHGLYKELADCFQQEAMEHEG